MGFSDVSDTDLRNLTNVSGTSCNFYQLSPISIGRLWEEAIAAQNVQSVQQLLNWGFDASGDGALMIRPPLILAVFSGNSALVKILLTAGADINCHDMECFTPLHLAAAAGERNIVKLLLVAGADLYARTRKGLFPLHLAKDSPTYQMLSKRMRSDMDGPLTPSRIDLPHESSSGTMMQLDFQALTESSVPSQTDIQGKEISFSSNDNQSSTGTQVEGPKKRASIFRCGSDSNLLLSKISLPSRINPASLSTRDFGGSMFMRDVEEKDPSYNENCISSVYGKGVSDEGKQPKESHCFWLQNLLQDKTKSQEATKAAMLRNQEWNHPEGGGQIDLKEQRLNAAEEVVGGLSKPSIRASSRSELENQDGLKNMLDQVLKDRENYSILLSDSQSKLDEKNRNKPACNVFERLDEGLDMKPARSESEISLCALNSLNISSGSNDTSQGMPSNAPADLFCSVNTDGSMKQKEQTIMRETVLNERKGALKDCGSSSHITMQSNAHSAEGPIRIDVKKLDEEDANLEDTSEVPPAHDHGSRKQSQERKQVKFVPPSEADFALVRKDWHKAVDAGCVGCEVEGCGGECIQKTAYGRRNQEKTSNMSSSSKSRKAFRKAQTKKTKHFEWKRGEVLGEGAYGKAFHEATLTDACKSIRGSVFWMAPEVIKGDNYGRHADMWSVGCTVIEMLTAMHPWPGIDNTWAAIFQIAKASSGPPVPETASDCAKDFLAKCFHLDPKMRANASELLEHTFVAKASEVEQGVAVQDV